MSRPPYYDEDGVTLYCGDAIALDQWCEADVLVTDPPFGIGYASGHEGSLPRSIAGDDDVKTRDEALAMWGDKPALVFGSWRRQRPSQTKMRLIWDSKGALGMGDLTLPWKPASQEIYVLGSGFIGPRGTDVLRYAPVQSSAWRGRQHPHEKPLSLMLDLLAKTAGTVADPFAGSGSTLVAAKQLRRRAIGVEIKPRYCDLIVERLRQGVLDYSEILA